MGVVSRYFERLGALVRPGRRATLTVAADAAGLRIGGEHVAWSDVRRLDAYKRDVYSGDLLCLGIAAADSRVFEINEESPGWEEAGSAIERFLPGSMPYAEWKLRLIAAESGESVSIYPEETA